MKILVTGGAGYIGSHTCVEFINGGHAVVVIDNFCNSSVKSLEQVRKITNCSQEQFFIYHGDICDKLVLQKIFKTHCIDAVVHFAGFKSVSESFEKPLEYYRNNVVGTLNLLDEMEKVRVRTIIFSSSATVYGKPKSVPIKESAPVSAINPYGRSKLIVENILQDLYVARPNWNIGLLRYFNPVGAHQSGMIGELLNGVPSNIMPIICQVATGKLEKVKIFGGDYSTHDGTGVRDYIHIVDLARGHIAALNFLVNGDGKVKNNGVLVANLGTGKGYSVLELMQSFEKVTDKKIPYEIICRRDGDVAECFADTELAEKKIGWKSQLTLQDMCEDAWRWVSNNEGEY